MPIELLTICHMHPCQQIPRHGIFLQRQAKYLQPLGINCTFLVPRAWVPWPLSAIGRSRGYANGNPLIHSGHPLHEAKFLRLPGRWFAKYDGRAMGRAIVKSALALHQSMNFDAVWACPIFPDAVGAMQLKQRLGLPVATLSIGSDIMVHPNDPTLKKQIQKVLTESDLCLGVSDAICGKMQELAECNPMRVFLGRDNSLFRPADNKTSIRNQLGLPADAIVATYVGLMAKTKGIVELSEATKVLLKNDRFHLICVGGGQCMSQMEQLSRSRVHLVGEQPPERVPMYLQAADMFVFPSYSEGMPQSVLEAMHCGLPIVATAVGGTPEAVTHEDNGLLIAPRRADLLLQAMERMVDDSEFRQQAGQRSLAIVEERFNSESHAAILANAFKDLCNRSPS